MPDLDLVQKYVAKALENQPAVVQKVDELRVEYRFQRVDLETKVYRYWGGVRATYGVSVLLCEELEVDTLNKTGVARGKVQLIDPDGGLEASDLRFSYGEEFKTGSADNVQIQIDRVKVNAQRLRIEGKTWVLENMNLTPSKTRPPEFELRARKVELEPGKSGKARGFGVKFFGWDIGAVPYITFSLDKRVTGFRLPAIAFQRGQGVGVGWGSTFLLNDQTSVTGKFVTLPMQFPSYTFEVAGSSVAPEAMIGRLTTRNDLQERLNDSYFDSVLVQDRNREVRAYRGPKATWSIGSYWNQATRGRAKDSEQISKPFDAAYELGGKLGHRGGYLGQVRAQSIRPDARSSDEFRLASQWIAHSGWYPIGKRLSTGLRLDSDLLGEYGWLRAAGMLHYDAGKVQLAGGFTETMEWGRPQFVFDEPFNKRAAHFRADVNLGSITASSLVKYDFERRSWTDVEYGLSLVAGSFEPYLNYRQYPRTLQFGIRLRLQDLFEKLSDRQIEQKRKERPGSENQGRP